MSEKNTFTRRQFLHTGLAIVSTVTTAPAFLSRSASAMADTSMRVSSKAGVPEDRVLVVVQLSGGNDGLNTVVPYGMSEYYNARPRLSIPERQVIDIDARAGIGLHPSLRGVADLMGDGLATVIQGVGYPNPNRSHFASMDVWHSGDTRGAHGHGWIGRAMDGLHETGESSGMDCICMGTEAPLAAHGRVVKPVAFQQPHLFQWTTGNQDREMAELYRQLQQNEEIDADTVDPTSFIFRTAMDAQVASTKVREAVGEDSKTKFPNGRLAQQLKMVAAMIRAELPTRVYYVAQGGYDTHANQSGQHANLLKQFSDSMKAFYRELEATGQQSRVVTLAFSEFGRRVRQNASVGTDHGAAGPMFIFGEHARSGLVGSHPSLTNLDRGDLIFNVDFRSVYQDVLQNWMKLDGAAAFAGGVTPLNIMRTA